MKEEVYWPEFDDTTLLDMDSFSDDFPEVPLMANYASEWQCYLRIHCYMCFVFSGNEVAYLQGSARTIALIMRTQF